MKSSQISQTELIHLCRRCGRKLTNPEAQKVGMGYICYRKFLSENSKRKLFQTNTLQINDINV